MVRDEVQTIAKHLKDHRVIRIAQACCGLDQRIENFLHIDPRRSSKWTRQRSKITEPASAQGRVRARGLVDFECGFAPTISDETRGSSRVMFRPGRPAGAATSVPRDGKHHRVHPPMGPRTLGPRSTLAGVPDRCGARAGIKPAPLSAPPILILVRPRRSLLSPRPQNSRAAARSSGQGRPSHQPRCWLAATRPLLEGCEHGGPLRRLGAKRRHTTVAATRSMDGAG